MIFRSLVPHVLDAVYGKPPEPDVLFYGFVTVGLEEAFARACTRLRVTPLQIPIHGFGSKSCGGRVTLKDGSECWLKVSGVPRGSINVRREREKAERSVTDIRTPQVFATTTWLSRGAEWYAVLMAPVSSPTVEEFDDAGGSLARDDAWIGRLRATLGQIASIPTTHRCMTEAYVAESIRARFGRDTPTIATEWQTAHGDLSWPNLTVPDLVIFDWETWGLAPRGYDAAYLMVHSIEDPDLMTRLEHEFSDEFSTPSGRVGLLLACAEMLNYIEADNLGERHGRNIEAIAHRALQHHGTVGDPAQVS